MPDVYINIAFLISGLIIGSVAHRLLASSSKKIRNLQNKLKIHEEEHRNLQNNLDNYFNDANSIAAKLAEEYQTLISKISEGTRKFSSFSKNVHYPAIINNINNSGIENNMPYTVDSLNNNDAITITAAKSRYSTFDNKKEKDIA